MVIIHELSSKNRVLGEGRPKTGKVKKGVRNTKLKGWKFANSDKPKVRRVIEGEENPRKDSGEEESGNR